MRYQECYVTLRDGSQCRIASPEAADAAKVLEHMRLTSEETHHMLRHAEEIQKTADEEAAYLEAMLESPSNLMIAAFIGDELAGNAGIARVGDFSKIRHRARFGISVKKKYWGRGIGWTLTQAIMDEAKKWDTPSWRWMFFLIIKALGHCIKKQGLKSGDASKMRITCRMAPDTTPLSWVKYCEL